jgi:hypothetical protein
MVLALVAFFVLLFLPFGLLAFYIVLLVATVLVVRSVPVQPGMWLGRRKVRRILVLVTALLTLGLALPWFTFAASGTLWLILLALCDLALGRATQRIGSAESYELDERQEAIRNRAHRIAYPIFAITVGAVVLIAEAATPTREWMGSWQSNGSIFAFVEVLFFLPAMVIAWLEPDRLPADGARAVPAGRSVFAAAMVALCLTLPFALTLTVFFAPIRTSAFTQPQFTAHEPGSATSECRYFGARKQVGYGIGVSLPISAVACWDGTKAFESWGLNESDCHPSKTSLLNVTRTLCQRRTDADGTLRFSYRVGLSSPIIPFLERDVEMTLAVTKDGKVVQFP